MLKQIGRYILSLLAILGCCSVSAQPVDVGNIDIVRDLYGVPHIFTETDREAVYGIAWTQCEDNFNMMQSNFAAVRGMAARIDGKDGAILDLIYSIFRIEDHVEKRFELDVGPEMKELLDAYTAAINRYAELHPKEVLSKKLFPLSARDAIANYCLGMLLTHNSVLELGKLLTKDFNYDPVPTGSNAMAFNKGITSDQKTYLVGNPHQPVNHFSNFWECSVHSKEGLEFFGVTFSGGGLTPVIGTNRNLGWTHTTNYQNCSDVYLLEMHPDKKLQYKYDGEWLELEEQRNRLRVKVGPLVIPVNRKSYWSKYGPVLKRKDGYYAFKSNNFYNLKAAEQWYRMALAQDFETFRAALDIQGIPLQTFTYADKESNIYHLSMNIHPRRSEDFDWTKVLPGNTSKNNWSFDNVHPISDMPQIKNPSCGYLYDCNNTVFDMTAPEENLKPEDYPASWHLLKSNTVRAKSLANLIASHSTLSYEDIRKIRESVYVDKNDLSFRNCTNCDDIPKVLQKHPELKNAWEVFDKWDGHYSIDNKQAGILALSSYYLTDYVKKQIGNIERPIPEEEMVKAVLKAEKHLRKHFGTLEVPLGEIQRAVRFDTDVPMYGNINTLANGSFEGGKKGKLELSGGDTYIMYAVYGTDGLERLETINVFGNSNKEGHPHSTDQTELYINKKTKRVELDLHRIKDLGLVYHPE